MATITAEDAERFRAAAESQGDSSNLIPGQTSIVPPEDDPDPDYDKDAFVAEAGEAVGPMPPRPADETVYVEELRIDGTTQVALNVGGKAPQSCEITFSGKAVVDGFFHKGDRVAITGTVLVVSEGAEDKLDRQTGIVTEAVQKHKGKLIDLRVA